MGKNNHSHWYPSYARVGGKEGTQQADCSTTPPTAPNSSTTPPTGAVTYTAKPSTAIEILVQENGAVPVDGAPGADGRRLPVSGGVVPVSGGVVPVSGGVVPGSGALVPGSGALVELEEMSTEALEHRDFTRTTYSSRHIAARTLVGT
jgi:hypothetical protein